MVLPSRRLSLTTSDYDVPSAVIEVFATSLNEWASESARAPASSIFESGVQWMGKFGLASRESDSAKRWQIRSDDHTLRQTSRLPEKQLVTNMAFNDAGTLLAKRTMKVFDIKHAPVVNR